MALGMGGTGCHVLGSHWASHSPATALQGSAPLLVAMVILLNIGIVILFINFFI